MPVKIPPIKEFPADGRVWRIEWFGAVERTPAEARIEVLLRRGKAGIERPRDPKQHFDGETWRARIGVGQLPFLTIGSLWRDKRPSGGSTGDELTLPEVKIDSSTVRLISAGTKLEHGFWAIPPFALKIEADVRSAKCLAIERDGDPYGILLPVSEAIRFFYAVSTDLAHITFSGALQHSPNDVYDASLTGMLRERSRMVVRLRQWLADDDAWIIGRSLASPVAAAGMARVYDSLVENSVNQRSMFPECGLPFEGRTRWRARGRILPGPVQGSKRFLIFELLHCTSSFPFDELEVMRTNDSTRAPAETDLPEEEKRPGWATMQSKPDRYGDEELQSSTAPDTSMRAINVALAGERFAALFGKRIEKTLKEQCRYKSSSFIRPADVEALSTGDSQLAETAVGQIKFTAEDLAQQKPSALPASLEALTELENELNRVSGVSAHVRPRTEETTHIPLAMPRHKAQWGYLNSQTRRMRQVGIVDIFSGATAASFVEFEHRRSESRAAVLLCWFTGTLVSDHVLANVLAQVARTEGVWVNIPKESINGVILQPYAHRSKSTEKMAGAVLRAMAELRAKLFPRTSVDA